jgi:hypothetical protein
MKPRKLLRLRKVVVEAGSWKVVTGKAKMPGTAFPLSKSFSIQLGRNWHWRVDVTEGSGILFRVLTAYNLDLEEYRAVMTVPRGNQHVVIASLEFHGTHPGWHCHLPCCDLEDVEAGQGRPRSSNRIPGGHLKHRRKVFGMTESTALAKSFGFFVITGIPEGSLI